MPVLNPQALVKNRVQAILDYHNATGVERAELDVSGGLDSAVMLGLLANALGPENVTAVYQGINSSPDSLARAREVAEAFGVKLIEIDLTFVFDTLVGYMKEAIIDAQVKGVTDPWWGGHPGLRNTREVRTEELEARIEADPLILGSLRSCLRAPVGRGFNRMMGGGIRHGTGNECEDRWCRFYQKGGDGEVDTNPIAMLSKGEVYQLAIALGVPKSIIEARPSPDLWGQGDKHNDEDEYAEYFGFDPEGHTFYSYVDPETGEYTHVGLIERVSRWLDEIHEFVINWLCEKLNIPGLDQYLRAIKHVGEK